MAELPAPPSLDLDGKAPEDAAAAETPATAPPEPVPVPAPNPSPTPVPAPAPEPPAEAAASEQAPSAADPAAPSKVGTQPTPAASVPKAVPAPTKPPALDGIVQDSVEEVLQQTSAQTLQLSHLEDILSALNQTLTDLQDEMHAGFAEIRAVTESVGSGEGMRRTEVAGGESLTQRIEFVEEQAMQTNKKQGLLTALAIGQGVLLIILLIVVLVGMRSGPTTEIPDANYTTSSSHDPEIKKPPPPPVEEMTRKKKRRRKR